MFKGLRNRFLFLHMVIVTLIIFAFFSINFMFVYQGIESNANEMFRREREFANRQHTEGFNGGMEPRPRFSPIFTIMLDENSNVKDVKSSFDEEPEFYESLSKLITSKSKEKGEITYERSTFKYIRMQDKIVCLDISRDMQMLLNTIYTFLWIALPLLFVIFIISLYFANRSIKPIEESYNKQKEFIADASHELKTPLAVISTNVDMLLGSANNEQQKWLSYIKSEVERMTNLTKSLLFLTKLDYIEEDAEATVDISKLLEHHLLPLEALFYENKITAKIDILPGILVKGDSEQLKRLMGVLVDNAIKYTSGSIRITLEKEENSVVFTIFNTGKGIPPSELNHIWDRFYRGDKSRESTGGFGLGLPIAKAIAEKHKGSIEAESKENQWTRFILKLPLER